MSEARTPGRARKRSGAGRRNLPAACMAAALAGAAVWPAGSLAAQGASAPDDASIAAIGRLAFMVGEWRGTGTTTMGPGNVSSSDVTERATLVAGGTALLLEGLGTMTEGGRTRVVHEALGIVTWNPAAGAYEMRAFRAGQGWTDSELALEDGRLSWGMETPGGRVRFTLDFGEEGRWHEVGEIERGGSWYRFLEMDLRKGR